MENHKKMKKYIIKFKDQKIDPIKFIITEDNNNCRVFNYVTVKEENYILNANGTYEQIINWVKEKLWKFPIEEIKEDEINNYKK